MPSPSGPYIRVPQGKVFHYSMVDTAYWCIILFVSAYSRYRHWKRHLGYVTFSAIPLWFSLTLMKWCSRPVSIWLVFFIPNPNHRTDRDKSNRSWCWYLPPSCLVDATKLYLRGGWYPTRMDMERTIRPNPPPFDARSFYIRWSRQTIQAVLRVSSPAAQIPF